MTDNVNYTDSYITKKGLQSWHPITWRAYRYLAIKENEKLVTNPGGDFILQPSQVLIAFGSKEQLNVLNGLLGNLVVAVELFK